jgi:hypothetical protein
MRSTGKANKNHKNNKQTLQIFPQTFRPSCFPIVSSYLGFFLLETSVFDIESVGWRVLMEVENSSKIEANRMLVAPSRASWNGSYTTNAAINWRRKLFINHPAAKWQQASPDPIAFMKYLALILTRNISFNHSRCSNFCCLPRALNGAQSVHA